jgi:transcriptional regulator with XRE-family HTH domain
MPSAAFLQHDKTGRPACQQPANDFLSQCSKRPHIDRKSIDKGSQMSLPNPIRTFRDRFADALRRRLAPNTNLTVSQLAGAIGVSDQTIKNLMSKANEPSARVIDECVALFKDSFLNEVYGCHHIHCIDTLHERRAAALRRVVEAEEELRRLG